MSMMFTVIFNHIFIHLQKNCVNMKIKKNEAKVVDSIDIEDFDGEKAVFCRCWKSEKVSEMVKSKFEKIINLIFLFLHVFEVSLLRRFAR